LKFIHSSERKGNHSETLSARGYTASKQRPLPHFAGFFVRSSSIAFDRFSARLKFSLESRFEMFVFDTRYNIGAMSVQAALAVNARELLKTTI
jgi:hypothetical protein